MKTITNEFVVISRSFSDREQKMKAIKLQNVVLIVYFQQRKKRNSDGISIMLELTCIAN